MHEKWQSVQMIQGIAENTEIDVNLFKSKLKTFLFKKFPASRGLSRRGKNERKERDSLSLLSLIFASSWETSASREFKKV